MALDRDPAAVALAAQRLADCPAATVIHSNYARLGAVLDGLGIAAVDGVLLDAGLSSMQIGDAGRGFSFQADGPLDMRMDTVQTETAADYLAAVSEETLARDLKQFGDVGPARRIARAVVRRRAAGRLQRTGDLAAAVREALPFAGEQPEEIRTVFQAVRMAVNEELRWLESALEQAVDRLRPGGRLVAMAFHSGEDRAVKRVLQRESRPRRELRADGRVRAMWPARLRVLTPKPLRPGPEELQANPRAKSARLRAAERLSGETES